MTNHKPTGDELKEDFTQRALEVAKKFGIRLDFSHKSIKRVEKLLGKIHKEYAKTQNEEGLRGIALFFAAYIVTVIERNSSPGVWGREHPGFGDEAFPFEWQDVTLFPYEWCLKRIFDGDQDNVWIKYKAIVLSKINQ